MPYRKLFALVALEKSISPRQTMFFSRIMLFTIITNRPRMEWRQKSAVDIWPRCANWGGRAAWQKRATVERKRQCQVGVAGAAAFGPHHGDGT
jgi:hypothetical protein